MSANMKRIWVIGIAVGALTVAGVTAAGSGGHHGKMRGKALASVLIDNAERLQLDEATRAQIQEIGEAARRERKSLAESARNERKVLHELLSVDSPDEAAVLAQADVVGAIQTEKRKAGLRGALALRALLSSDQRAELAQIQTEKRERRREHRKGRRDGDRPGF